MSASASGAHFDSREHMLQLFATLTNIDALRASMDVALLQRDQGHASGGIATAQSLIDLQEVEIQEARRLASEIETHLRRAAGGEGDGATH